MNAAAIDLGTNSVKILIVRRTADGHTQVLFKHRSVVRLGEGVFSKGKIAPKVQARTLKVLNTYAKLLDAYNVDMVRATGTSALREAKNGAEFVQEVRQKTGLALEVLPADEEARLIVKGVTSEFPLPKVPVYFIDIGGGSAEVTEVVNKKIQRIVSFPFGAVRLTETFLLHNPPLPTEVKKLDQYILKNLKLKWSEGKSGHAIAYGSAGTIRALARLVNKTELNSDERTVTKAQLDRVAQRTLKLSVKQIDALPGIDSKRAEIFAAGVRVLVAVFDYFGIRELRVSNRGLREGLLIDLFETPTKPLTKIENAERDRMQELLAIGRKFHSNQSHTRQVWSLAKNLFDALTPIHGLDARFKNLLMTAALLHDVGHYVAEEGHHKHTLYILKNTRVSFLSDDEMKIVACVARYHRKSPPRQGHDVYDNLTAGEQKTVNALAALLRVADALDAPHDQGVRWVNCQWGPGKVHLQCDVRPGGKLNQDVIADKIRLFEDTFKSKITVSVLERTAASQRMEPPPSLSKNS